MRGATAVDLENYTLTVYESDGGSTSCNADRMTTFPALTLAPNGFAVVGSPEAETAFNFTSDISIATNFFENSSHTIVLADSTGAPVQVVFITDGWVLGESLQFQILRILMA